MNPGNSTKRHRPLLRGLGLAALALLGLYALVGFVVLPWAARTQIPKQAQATLGADLTIQRVTFNPFTLRLGLDNVDFTDEELGHLVSLEHFLLDLQWASLWRGAILLKDLQIIEPRISGKRYADGRFQLQRLGDRLPAATPEPDDAGPGELPRLVLEHFYVDEGQLLFTDATVRPLFVERFGPASLEFDNLSTLPEDEGDLRFQVATEEGGHYEWQGRVAVNPPRSTGRLDVRNESIRELWEYVEERVAFEVTRGRLGLGFDYRFRLGDEGPEVEVENGSVTVDDLLVTAGEEVLALPEVLVTGAAADLQASDARVERVSVNGGRLAAWLEADGTLNLERLFAASSAAAPGPGSETPAETAPTEAGPADPEPEEAAEAEKASPPMTVSLEALEIRGFSVALEDRSRQPAVALALDPIDFTVSEWSSDPGSDFGVALAVNVSTGGRIAADGRARLEPTELDAAVEVADLALELAQPYVGDLARVRIDEAELSLNGRIRSDGEETLRFEGTVSPGALQVHDTLRDEPLVGWEGVETEKVSLALDAGRLDIERVAVQAPYMRLRIDEEGNLNLADVVIENETAPEPEVRQPEVRQPAGGQAGAEAPEGDAADGAAPPPLQAAVGRVVISDGSMDFADLSLPLPFEALIHDMDGEVANIASAGEDPARIQLEGRVNETGSNRIEGILDLLDVTRQADIAVVFENVDMPRLTPYTAKFGGYEIDEGKLDLDLRYKLSGGLLESTNRVVIDRLTLGDKVESPDAMNVPLKLAVALLKDPSGRIDLELPVTGDVNDPDFHYGGLVMKVLGNALVKIVTAPFKALGALVGAGDEDLEFVEFPLGRADLDESDTNRIGTIAEALTKRPALRLEIPAVYDPEADGRAIRADRLDTLLEERRAQAGDDDGRSALEAIFAETRGAEAAAALEAEYTTVPEDGGDPVLDGPGYLAALRDELVAEQPLSDTDLTDLGAARAAALQSAVAATGQLPPERVLVGEPAEGGEALDDVIRIKLGLAPP